MRALSALMCLSVLAGGTAAAAAGECPGNPDALGTSRVINVDPTEHARIGGMQYHESLPLADKEVVLTFDDGPLPPYTNRVLETLAAECVKATFFMVGRQARAFPAMVRQVYNEGHTVATHSQNHPRIFTRLSMAGAESEIAQGQASVAAALGDERALAPFFRFPGLGRSDAIEAYLAAHETMTWSADFPADDWTRISAQQVLARALDRLERKGKGVLLLHDIQPRTALALPALLRALKARGYHIVHVVPAGQDRPKTLAPPEAWVLQRSAPPMWPRVLERDPALAETNPGVGYPEQTDWPITLASAPARPETVAVPLLQPAPGRSRIWPEAAHEFTPVGEAQVFARSNIDSPDAVVASEAGLSWSARSVAWPRAPKPMRATARPKHGIHFRPATAGRSGRPPRPAADIPPPARQASRTPQAHILTLR
jgi:peptidoglycan/xylan/chitin deacetylase (PgdA/CDA1 family)